MVEAMELLPPASSVSEGQIKSKTRPLFIFGSLLLLVAGTVGAVFLAKTSQETKTSASGWGECKRWSGGTFPQHWFNPQNRQDPVAYKIHYRGTVDLQWRNIYWCDYQKLKAKGKFTCEEEDKDAWLKEPQKEAIYTEGYTPGLEELIEQSHYQGNCQVIQVDVTGCPGWDGGVAFVVYANDYCPAPTPSPSVSPTPTSSLSCSRVVVYDQSWQRISDLDSLKVGDQIYLAVSGETDHPAGVTKARLRLIINGQTGEWQETQEKNQQGEFYRSFTITEAGDYEVEGMVFNPDLGWR